MSRVNERKYLRDYARLWHVMPIFVRKLTTKLGKQKIKQGKTPFMLKRKKQRCDDKELVEELPKGVEQR